MVSQKLASIPKEIIIKYWSHCALELYRYCDFQRI